MKSKPAPRSKHLSTETGQFAIDINKGGQLFNIKVDP
jgi:hypothetical protein